MVLNAEVVTQRYFAKNVVLVEVVHRKKPVIESLKEETLAQVFSFEF